MAWSKWRGAVVLMLLGSVGLAWSQSPMFNRPANTSSSERNMTVHEDGKSLRCRVMHSWRTSAGAQAHQLQVIETGAMLTIVEDGQPTTVAQSPGRQVRALPMRIFHWGLRDRMPPPGTPMPPQTIQTAAATPPASATSNVIQRTSAQVTTAMPTTAMPAKAMPVITTSACNQCVTGRGPRLAGCTHCKERIISWEDGSGKPVSVYPGSSIVQAGQTDCPVIVERSRTGGHTESMPTIIEGSRQTLFPRLFPARSETVVIVPEKSSPSGVVNAAVVSRPQSQGNIVTSTPVTMPSAQPSIAKGATVTMPSSTTTIMPSPEIVCDTEKPTVRDKLHNLFHKPGLAKPAEPKAVETKKADKAPTQLPAPAAKKDDKKPSTVPAAPVAKKDEKKQFSTATAQPTATPKATPLAIPSNLVSLKKDGKAEAKDDAIKAAVPKKDANDWRNMWGKQADGKVEQPGQATIEREKVRKELPPASQTEGKRQDILMAPEKFNPENEKVNPKVSAELANMHLPQQPAGNVPMPLGVQSVLSARNGVQGPVQYIPVPVAIVPEPIRPPTPPEPKLPEPPNPAAYVNAFSSPPAQGQQQPPLTPEQMQVIMKNQALMQQQAYLQHLAMMQRTQNGQMAQLVPVGNGMPMQVRYPANYTGPQAPNPAAQQQPMFPLQQVGYMPPAQFAGHPAMDRRVIPVAAQQPVAPDSNTLGQLISVLQESPYPAQREWAAMNLATFDYRVYPHLAQVLVQAARQDSAPTVRAAAIYSLSRMNVQSEPVLGALQALRGDADPRVRQEVEQAHIRMGLTPRQ